MKVSELIEYLGAYLGDHDVVVADFDVVHEVVNHEEWRHLQTGESLGAVVLIVEGDVRPEGR